MIDKGTKKSFTTYTNVPFNLVVSLFVCILYTQAEISIDVIDYHNIMISMVIERRFLFDII